MPSYRILSLDGGNGLSIANLLRDVENQLPAERKHFLNHVDLFAGTSFGGMSAMFLARRDDPSSGIDELAQFCGAIYENLMRGISIPRFLTAVAGQSALESTDPLRQLMIEEFGATATLGDLKHPVMVVSFQLDNGATGPERSWAPRIFTNFPDDPDCNELIVDVAMRTSAVPIVNPIYQSMAGTGPGFIDGGVVANNPAMCALAQALPGRSRKDILLMSIGIGRNVMSKVLYLEPPFNNGVAQWGYGHWLLNPKEPLVLLDMFFQGAMDAVDYQCSALLGTGYQRLNPANVQSFRPQDLEVESEVQQSVAWLASSGWFEAPDAPAQ